MKLPPVKCTLSSSSLNPIESYVSLTAFKQKNGTCRRSAAGTQQRQKNSGDFKKEDIIDHFISVN